MKKELDLAGRCGSCEYFKKKPGEVSGRCQAKTDIPGSAPWCGAFISFFGEVEPHPMVTRGQKKCGLYQERTK